MSEIEYQTTRATAQATKALVFQLGAKSAPESMEEVAVAVVRAYLDSLSPSAATWAAAIKGNQITGTSIIAEIRP